MGTSSWKRSLSNILWTLEFRNRVGTVAQEPWVQEGCLQFLVFASKLSPDTLHFGSLPWSLSLRDLILRTFGWKLLIRAFLVWGLSLEEFVSRGSRELGEPWGGTRG